MRIQLPHPERLREQFHSAEPFPNICIDDFFEPTFAEEVYRHFPSFEEATQLGHSFAAVNEKGKVQICDANLFPPPFKKLTQLLADSQYLETLSYVTGISHLLPDDQLHGGGIHETTTRGRLDVHVDFNLLRERQWHRRLNIIIFFNKDWQDEWGGRLELWDRHVKHCIHSFEPIFNRCIIFQTSEISYHGVTPLTCPTGVTRKSFAAYYYTEEAPAGWDGRFHSTVFKARPNERVRGKILMPAEKAKKFVAQKVRGIKSKFFS